MAASIPEGVGGKDEDVKKSVEFLYVAAVYILMILYPHIPPSPWQFYSVVTKLSSAHHLDWRILLCGGVSNMN